MSERVEHDAVQTTASLRPRRSRRALAWSLAIAGATVVAARATTWADPIAPSGAAQTARFPVPTTPDPLRGHFTLAEATAGLPGSGPLRAIIEVPSQGEFRCELFANEAPITVANFVGLARGLRDFWDPVQGAWRRGHFYDGSIFHRVIPGFMIQGGDYLRSGTGGTGYEIPDEHTAPHDRAGLLCMANHGPNTNGGQFFITEVPVTRLDGSYTIFGLCRPTALIPRIAAVPRDGRDRPRSPVFIRRVTITR